MDTEQNKELEAWEREKKLWTRVVIGLALTTFAAAAAGLCISALVIKGYVLLDFVLVCVFAALILLGWRIVAIAVEDFAL